jgi:DNA-binding SARP family transcriptional activator/tetratricopeptide (TPR) repeat protein
VTFGLLGPVEVRVDGRPVPLGGPHARAVLAALLLDANRVVPVARLIDVAWGDAPPPSVQVQARNRVSELRRVLREAGAGSDVIGTRGSGYLAVVRDGQLDVDVFERLVHLAADREPAEAIGTLDEALALWRGPALDGLRSPLLAAAARRLDERRVTVRSQRLELGLRLGGYERVIGELVELVAAHPANELLVGQLMTALYLADRQGEALHHFETVRRALRDELGIDPGPQLTGLRDRILRNDPALRDGYPPLTRTPPTDPAARRERRRAQPTPRELPTDVRGFAGREREIAILDATLSDAATSTTAVVIATIAGTAGVGKTALAVHWGHRVADRFPDGQLYVNLRGYHTGAPMPPLTALAQMLRSLGAAPERIPDSVDEAAAQLRSVLAGRRVLVVLDNARSEEQVRPLLPGSPGCFVVVSSRSTLPGLVATEGAHLLPLDLLSAGESRCLLANRLGSDRLAAATDAVDEIIDRCARLPLAMAIVAARAAARPGFGLDRIAAELRDARGGLDPFTAEDTATDVRAVFSWSYRGLAGEAARLFRLLGLHPGPDLSLAAAASLAGAPAARVRGLLAALTRAHLVTEHVPDRYTMHDLLRAYAAELAEAEDDAAERRAAEQRVLDHYVHTGFGAARRLSPHQDVPAPAPPGAGAVPEEIADHARAMEWFQAEHSVLLAAVQRATAAGFDGHCWQLAWALEMYLEYRGHWYDLTTVWGAGLAAAERLGDRRRQARAHRGVALGHTRLHRYPEAAAELRLALDTYTELDDLNGQAHALRTLNWLHEREGRQREALGYALQALELFSRTGHLYGQARSLNSAGWNHAHLGEYREALACCERALALHQEIGDEYGEAAAWDSLGYAHHHLGDHRQAVACYERSLALTRRLGSRYNEALVLRHLGDSHHAGGAPAEARKARQEALDILDDLDHPDAEAVREQLRGA